MKQNCQTSLKMGCIMYLSLSVPFREYLMFLHFLARVASSSECKLTTIRNNGLQTPLSIELGFIKQITLCKELLYVACNAKIVLCVTINVKMVMEISSVLYWNQYIWHLSFLVSKLFCLHAWSCKEWKDK